MSLVATERATYEAAWALEAYGAHSPGQTYLPLFLDMAQPAMHHSILDAGCGSGKGALALQAAGFTELRLCDLTSAGLLPIAQALPFYDTCLWDDLRTRVGYLHGGRVDWVYCCDVLEHIPTPFTMLVVSRLLEVARRGVFLSIALNPDVFGAWVGKPLHQTVQGFVAWRDQLAAIGVVKEARDLLHCGVYLVTPR